MAPKTSRLYPTTGSGAVWNLGGVGVAYATVHAAADGTGLNLHDYLQHLSNNWNSNNTYGCERAYMCFDTSELDEPLITILSATLSLMPKISLPWYPNEADAGHSIVYVLESNQSRPITLADYGLALTYGRVLATIPYQPPNGMTRVDINLPLDILRNDYTKFCLLCHGDRLGLVPTGWNNVRFNWEFPLESRGYLDIVYLLGPTVNTNPATNIFENEATINGLLVDDGGDPPCACGFEWGFDTDYGNSYEVGDRLNGQTFAHVLIGLIPDAEYHFRAYATNTVGTAYGIDRTFKTLSAIEPELPTIKQIVTLEAIRNLEITYGGRTFVSKEGDISWESRFHR